jgi:hypothetical protein
MTWQGADVRCFVGSMCLCGDRIVSGVAVPFWGVGVAPDAGLP